MTTYTERPWTKLYSEGDPADMNKHRELAASS
jgi:hypothetical protein